MAKIIDCYICGKKNLTRNEIGLNKKLIGNEVKKFHCLQCLADYLEVSVEELEERITEFKDAGCSLFE
ncbi:MAG TPA: hypothetical protein PKI14_16795 [Fervidobacterium sp.]|jgi:uncharacterized protein YeeX (DUF496 family)|nr:hypothetical protein [Fervidobacterium sp.]HUM44604.1 hypothetical protein [Fervidobacterium sp.]